jgi:cytochrome c oxidase cbb3-type subunit 2
VKRPLVVAALAVVAAGVVAVPARAEVDGRSVYNRHCSLCHAVDGSGAGVAAALFLFPPRDFTKGVYKFRSTGSGQLPTDEDLKNTIVHGVPGSGMVPQDQLTDDELKAVIAYIKAFSPRFAASSAPRLVKIPAETPRESAPVERGREIYIQGGCPQCHGDSAKGDGPSAATLSVPPADLTQRPLKSGATARDIVKAIVTGLDGTPMPSYDLMFGDADMWALAYYVESLATPAHTTRDEGIGWHVESRQPRSAAAAQ